MPSQSEQKTYYSVDGMTCESCEVLIEKKVGTLLGVTRVKASASRGKMIVFWKGSEPAQGDIEKALDNPQYRFTQTESGGTRLSPAIRPSMIRIAGFFALAFIFGVILSRLGVLQTSASIGDGMTLGAAFVLGLVAATSSCLATVGGLLVSSLAESSRASVSGFSARFLPTFLFVAGRLLSYLLLGALIGVIGSALTPSPLVTGALLLVAALYMIVMGLDMLSLAPSWMKRMLPKMPKSIARKALSASEGSHIFAPFITGAATFFVPCGFTQSLQLYALTLGNPVQSAAILGVFALGTSPALFALGLSFSAVRGKVKELVFQFAGAVVVLMGLANVGNAFAITGYPLSLAWLQSSSSRGSASAFAPLEGDTQVMRMDVVRGGYSPNQFTIRAGLPTRWIVNGSAAGGCAMALSAPQLQIKKILSVGENSIEFTAPDTPGTYAFSCSMGMYTGLITVVKG